MFESARNSRNLKYVQQGKGPDPPTIFFLYLNQRRAGQGMRFCRIKGNFHAFVRLSPNKGKSRKKIWGPLLFIVSGYCVLALMQIVTFFHDFWHFFH